jgi:hypothetical protein
MNGSFARARGNTPVWLYQLAVKVYGGASTVWFTVVSGARKLSSAVASGASVVPFLDM